MEYRMSTHAMTPAGPPPSTSRSRLRLLEATERSPVPHDSPVILLFTHAPALAGLDSILCQAGLDAYRIHSLEQASQLLAKSRGRCAAVVDTTQAAPYRLDAVCYLLQETPAVPTLVLVNAEGQHSSVPWEETSRSHAEVTCLPASLRELLLRIQALLLRAGLAMPAAPIAPSPLSAQGHVVVLFGLKGGIGRSTLAANLAIGLAQQHGKRVALINADLWYNAQATLLDLHSDKSIASLAYHTMDLDAESLRNVLVPHPSGVQVLLGPADPVLVETIPPELPARVASAYHRWRSMSSNCWRSLTGSSWSRRPK
jgi:pilus assembly protein CpaE